MRILKIILIFTFLLGIINSNAQNVSINANGAAPDSSAMLDVVSTQKGMLIPRLTATQKNAISGPATGLMIFQTDNTPGFYFNAGTPAAPSWIKIQSAVDGSSLISDTDNDTKIQVEESADEDIIRFDQAGTEFFRMDSGRIDIININNSVAIGNNSGSNLISNASAYQNVVLGNNSMQGTLGRDNVGIGFNVMNAPTSVSVRENTAIGQQSMQALTSGYHNTALGRASLTNMETGYNNTAIGRNALSGNTGGFQNVALGNAAGSGASGNSNVFLGNEAGTGYLGDNALFIDNSNTTAPLIYGDFANDSVKIFGTLSVGNAFSFPTADGTNGQVLQTNGGGTIGWTSVPVPALLQDTDGDTKIQVEESADEDIIRFDIGGTERWVMQSTRIEPSNSGQSTYIGENAGSNDNLTLNRNVAIGHNAGVNLTDADYTVAIGYNAGSSLTISRENTFVGAEAGQAVTSNRNVMVGRSSGQLNTGNKNVFIGHATGKNSGAASSSVFIGDNAGIVETGSNKLYIENSSSSTPLIYGDFANDSVKIYGTLSIGDSITFPTNRGTNGQILKTDGTGTISWSTGDTNNLIATSASNYSKMLTTGLEVKINNSLKYELLESRLAMYGGRNVSVGERTRSMTNGVDNVAIGYAALESGSGNGNTAVGIDALASGSGNSVALGAGAGTFNNGNSNVFVGYQAGRNSSGSNILYIENSNSTTPLIYGDFANDKLTFNGLVTLDSAKDGSGYTLPGLKGTDGQVLTSDGAGKAVWEDAGSSPWNTSGSTINYTIGKVGIGTSAPQTTLHVAGGKLSLEGVSRSVIYNSALATRNILVIRADTALNNGAGINLYGTNDINYSDQIRFFTQNDFNNPNMVIDSSGRVAIGTESSSAKLTIAGTGEVATRINSYASALSENASLAFSKARGSEGSETAVVQNDIVGQVTVFAHDGSAYGALAKISFEMDAATGSGDLPGRIQFHTTADGASTTTERMRIDSDGNVGIGTDNPGSKLTVSGNLEVIGADATINGVTVGRGGGSISSNVAVGAGALANGNASNKENVAVGASAMGQNTSGTRNTALGQNALNANLTGDNNIAIGYFSLREINSSDNVGIGFAAGGRISGGSGNVFIGHDAGNYFNSSFTQNKVIKIGYQAGWSDTTDNKLYIENSNSATPLIYGDFANDSIKIFGSLSVGNEFTLPTSDGAFNSVLRTDGAGNVSWVSFAAASSLWNQSGTDINYTAGNVGIGIATPQTNLHINDNNPGIRLSDSDASRDATIFGFSGNVFFTSDDTDRDHVFQSGAGTSVFEEIMRITGDGNVGIGTSSPNNLLTVSSAVEGAYFDLKGVGDAFNFSGFKLDSDEGTDKSWAFNHRKVSGELNNFSLEYFDGSTYLKPLSIKPDGKIGLGSNNVSPTSTLDVIGNIEIDGNGGTGNDAFYFGDPTTNGSWRIKRDGNDLSFERREGGIWIFKMKINP